MTTRSLSLLAAALTLLVFASNADARARAGVKITASAAPWAVVGSQIGIKGGVTPHVAGLSVALQQRQGGGWTTVQATKIAAGGAFSFTAHPNDPGAATFRVVTAKGATAAGSSPTVVVRMLRWSYLADQYIQSPSGGELTTNPIAIHGVTYQHPVAARRRLLQPVERRCLDQLPAQGPVRDADRHGRDRRHGRLRDVASFTVFADGKQVAGSNLVYGQAIKLNIPLDGVKRLQLRINVPDPTGAAGCSAFYPKVVFGDAQWLGP